MGSVAVILNNNRKASAFYPGPYLIYFFRLLIKPAVLKGDPAVRYSIFLLCEDDDGVLGRGDV